MKKNTLLWCFVCTLSAIIFGICLQACLKSDGAPRFDQRRLDWLDGKADERFEMPPSGQHLSIDTANRMIRSYLSGINYKVNTEAIRAWTVAADSLRSYAKNSSVKYFTFTLAHTLDYMLSGHEGLRPDSNSHAYTLIVKGLNASYQTVTLPDGKVLDQMVPCPDLCVDTGL